MNWLMRFLSEDKKALFLLGQRIVGSLDTPVERKLAAEKIMATLSDGHIPPIEWTSLGKTLGVFKKK